MVRAKPVGQIQLPGLQICETGYSTRSWEPYCSERCIGANVAGMAHSALSVFLIGCPERQVHGNSPIIIQEGNLTAGSESKGSGRYGLQVS